MNSGITKDGFDIIFKINHLGHFLLKNSLLSLMEENGRIFNVSSDMHNPLENNFNWIGTEKIAKPDSNLSKDRIRYSYSKLCNLYFTYELKRKLEKENKKILVNAFNPGFMENPNFAIINPEIVKFIKEKYPDRLEVLKNHLNLWLI
jgi:NAD(P)-dependent dehydrogenase (short-subunit alcohol dehydrogenase family)